MICEEASPRTPKAAAVQPARALADTIGKDLTQQSLAPPSKGTVQLALSSCPNLERAEPHGWPAPGTAAPAPGNQNTDPHLFLS